MAELSMFWTTDGTGDGPSGGYGQSRLYRLHQILSKAGSARGKVVRGEGDLLAVTTPEAGKVSVASGVGWDFGFLYENTAALELSISAPGATAGGNVVLEADWTAQTVRAKAYRSDSGVATPPDLVQSEGTTWQMLLATFTISPAGVVSLTDRRWFGEDDMPLGSIMMWYGSLGGTDNHRKLINGNADESWHLCNGETVNGFATPDMRGRFPIGAGGTYGKGDHGGAETKNVQHTHPAGTLQADNHKHPLIDFVTNPVSGSGPFTAISSFVNDESGNAGASVSGTTGNGGSTAQNIMPPYRGVYFMMKVA